MRKEVKLIFSLTFVVFLMVALVSASVFSDLWNWMSGNHKNKNVEINFSPDVCYSYASVYFNDSSRMENEWSLTEELKLSGRS